MLLRESPTGALLEGVPGDVLTWDAATQGWIAAPGGGGGGAVPRIVWRSDGAGDAVTWAQVMALLGTKPGVQVYANQPGDLLAIPSGVYNMRRATIVGAAGPAAPIVVTQANGAVLHDLAGMFGGLGWKFTGTTGPSLTFPAGGSIFSLCPFEVNGLAPEVQNFGNVPVVQLTAANSPLLVGMSGTAQVALSNDGVTPFFNLTAATLVFLVSELLIPTPVANLMVSGNVGSLLLWANDGTGPTVWPSFPSFLGTEVQTPKGTNGGAGPTTRLPVPFLGPLPLGCQFWDSDKFALFQWNGLTWQNIERRTSTGEFLGPFPQVADSNTVTAWPGTTHTSATGRVLVTCSVRAPFINSAGVGFSSFILEAEANPGAIMLAGGVLVPIITLVGSVVPSDGTASGATFNAEIGGLPIGAPLVYSALLRLNPAGAPTTLLFDGSAVTAQMVMVVADLAP